MMVRLCISGNHKMIILCFHTEFIMQLVKDFGDRFTTVSILVKYVKVEIL